MQGIWDHNTRTDIPDFSLPVINKTAAPTTADNTYGVPTLWVDTTSNLAYLLVDVTGGSASWTPVTITDPLMYKGVIDCSSNPNYPAADAGHMYLVSVAGKIGGASGLVVTAGDIIICNTDGTIAGTQAAVGSYWNIMQGNLDMTNVAITGGTIDGTTIGGTTAAAGTFTSLTDSGLTASLPIFTDASKVLVSKSAADAFTALKQNATTSATGVVELATVAESVAGTSTTLTPTCDGVAAAAAVVKNPLAHAQGVNLTAASAAPISIADNDNIDFGTGDMTVSVIATLPDWTPSTPQVLCSKSNGSTTGWRFYVNTLSTSTLGVRIGANLYQSNAGANFADGTTHTVTAVYSYSANTVTFYADGYILGTAVSITPIDLSSAEILYIGGISSARYQETINSVVTFNRALTAAEVLSLYRNGIAYADKWGSQTAVYTSDFSEGVDSFLTLAGSVAGNIDGIGGEDNCLRFTSDNTAGNHAVYHTALFTGAKHYRINFKYYIPSSNSNIDGIRAVTTVTNETLYSSSTPLLDTWNSINVSVGTSGPTGTGVGFYALDGGTTVFTDSGGDDVIYIKDIVIYYDGATLALEPEGIQPAPGQWLDSSTNKLHAMQPATGSSLVLSTMKDAWMFFTTGTSDQYIHGGTTRAIFPALNYWIDEIYAYSAGTPTFTLGEVATSAEDTIVASTTLVASTWTKLSLIKNSCSADDIYVNFTAGGSATQFKIRYHLLDMA